MGTKARTIRAYHFVGETLRDGRPIPKTGEWLVHKGELEMCESGLHASRHPLDALKYAPGDTLCLVEMSGKILEQKDKLVAEKRRIIKRFNAEKMLRLFARKQALKVLHLWDAPKVVREYLETGDETKRAAAWAAARDAARDAARYAARDAARDAQNERLAARLEALHKEDK